MTHSEQIATQLLDIGAVTLNVQQPYTYSSGLKSPIYCDNRLVLSFPEARKIVTAGFVELFRALNTPFTAIAGIATGGIAYAALLADQLELPMLYIRSSAKSHGKQKAVEGNLEAQTPILLIEDLITTGGSALTAASAAMAEGAIVEQCCSIFTYGLAVAEEAFAAANIAPYSLCNLPTLLKVAQAKSLITEADVESILNWQQDPAAWSAKQS